MESNESLMNVDEVSKHAGQIPVPLQDVQVGGSTPQWTHRIELDGVRPLHLGQLRNGIGISNRI
jgi:hypothetical protein